MVILRRNGIMLREGKIFTVCIISLNTKQIHKRNKVFSTSCKKSANYEWIVYTQRFNLLVKSKFIYVKYKPVPGEEGSVYTLLTFNPLQSSTMLQTQCTIYVQLYTLFWNKKYILENKIKRTPLSIVIWNHQF